METAAPLRPAAAPKITCRHLSRRIASAQALDGVDVTLPGGDFSVLLGPSGCGKSTLLRLIAGLDAPSDGQVLIGGRDVPRPDVWETDVVKAYTAEFPQALVARDQLAHAVTELSTFVGLRVTQVLNSALAAAVTGQKSPKAALDAAQAEADAILAAYRKQHRRLGPRRCFRPGRPCPGTGRHAETRLDSSLAAVAAGFRVSAGLQPLYPAVQTLIDSFRTTPKGRRPSEFGGVANYVRILSDPIFARAMWSSAVHAARTIPSSITLALAMAPLVQACFAGLALMHMAFFTPTVLPLIAVANIRLFFCGPGFGLIDQFRIWAGFGSADYTGQPGSALYAVAVVTVRKETGLFMIFYLAALRTIPQSLRDAAAIEGCGRRTLFRRVTLPLIMPFVSVNPTIYAFRLVDHVFVMTRGGPDNASMLLRDYIFENGFRPWDTACAAAPTIVLVALLTVVGIAQFLATDRRVHYR
ncbi:MAG: ATP-binding cassette domain-containing protein [Gemmobacter sp.]|uniref:carbohydrate ABC transporter permease n=1 Tax=Gemmobacter sp. TaxID=1898957 RepID=UPI00391DD8B1